MSEKLLEIKNLHVHYDTDDGLCKAVNGVNLVLNQGESLGLVGETGAGKTTIARTILDILPVPPAKVVQGEVYFHGSDLLKKTEKEMQKIRGHEIAMIFQDPMSALNPVDSIGSQIAEGLIIHQKLSKREAVIKAGDMLEKVGIPRERFGEFPHQFSGGMKQRVVIAIALACNPELLLADEPTTALDVTIQAQVLELIRNLREELGSSLILITHDLGVVAHNCDKVAVMYAGHVMEYGSKEDIFIHAQHPYTIGLFASIPKLDKNDKRLKTIPGMMPNPMELPEGCPFAPRCSRATDACRKGEIPMTEVSPGHMVSCLHRGEEGA